VTLSVAKFAIKELIHKRISMVIMARDPKVILDDLKLKMQKAVDHTVHNFSLQHTGKADPSMVEGVMVEAYESTVRLRDVAAITTPDARMISIQPWDKGILKAIDKAIRAANLGLNPVVDGNMLRCHIPELSRERRQELVKRVSGMAEEGRVVVRNHRREAMDALKKMEKDGILSEDDLKRYEKDVQKLTDSANKDIDAHLKVKEEELLKV
jgi:ribosome recycling factor